ncbi:MAG: cation-efflux pump, partial [Acidobacteriaceae bacterium]|nr:cation-efflux pump [Acidobacteriaceae bacterium]
MSATRSPDTESSMRGEKRAVALNSVFAAIGITTLKIVVGLATNSLGILSEAAHSALDLIAAVVTFLSVRVSDKPADAEHQYGHGKVENFSAFIETALLLLTCVWIVWEAVRRLLGRGHTHVEPTVAAFLVMFASMGVDFWRSRSLQRVATKFDSQALQADALHFSTDVWSSGVVIFGLVLVEAGEKFHVPWLRNADPVAALFVSGVIVYVSSRLARQTVDALLDAAPRGVRGRILAEVAGVEGVLDVNRARIRRAGNRYFADVSIALRRNVTFQKSEQVASQVTSAVHRILPDADVIVHPVPRAAPGENIFERIRDVASRNNLTVHEVSVQEIGGRLHVEQHLELDERMSLKNAHDVVSHLESQIGRDVPEVSSILTHIESEPATIETTDEVFHDQRLERRLRAVATEFPEILDMHDLVLKKVGERV